jgi:hypothetical protein
MHRLALLASVAAFPLATIAADPNVVTYEAKAGPAQGKHVVLLSGDEEYRSEEAMPMLGRLLAERHGFKATVLFAVDPDGTINPNNQGSISGAEALDSADLVIMSLRFRKWPDADLKHFADYVAAGKPFIGLRTSTHAFAGIAKDSPYAAWNWNTAGGFGKKFFGETWVSHWGSHKKEATKAIVEPGAALDPLLKGVENVFGTTDVYEAHPPADAKILLQGQVLKGMNPSDEPADYKKKRSNDKQEQGVNDPLMPVAWTREVKNDAGKTNKVLCTTMGAATDLENEGLRRLIVNAAYAFTGLEVPAKADVTIVGEYHPTMYGFGGYKKGQKPSDYAVPAK